MLYTVSGNTIFQLKMILMYNQVVGAKHLLTQTGTLSHIDRQILRPYNLGEKGS